MKKAGFCIIVLILGWGALRAQEWKSLNADELFKLARQTAFDGNREESRKMLLSILERDEDYDEVRIFLARTYGWDSQFEQANGELKKVLDKRPFNEEALEVLVDLGIWSNNFDQALADVDRSLKVYPNSQQFLLKKASILVTLKQPEEAARQVARLLEINPSNAEAITLMKDLKNELLKFFVGFSAGLDHFSRTFNNAYNGSLQFGTRGKWGTGIARLNYSNRFSRQGWQPELELYPRLSKKVYAYLNYGYSNSLLFPRQRIGGELYSSAMKNFEISAGLRYLYFNDTVSTTIYTGSVGYYAKNYWISFRPFYSVATVANTFSNTLNVRRYFKNSDNYLGFNGGFGFTPDERRFQSAGGLSGNGIYILKTQRVGATWQKTLPANVIINFSLNFTRQEQTFDAGNYLWITSGTVWVRKRF
jgi:YaiO family outer membrane protein